MNRATLISSVGVGGLLLATSTKSIGAAENTNPGILFPHLAKTPNVGHAAGTSSGCKQGVVSNPDQAAAMLSYYKLVVPGFAFTPAILPLVAVATGVLAAFVAFPIGSLNGALDKIKDLKFAASVVDELQRINATASAITKVAGGAQPLGTYLAVVQNNKYAGTTTSVDGKVWQPTADNYYGLPCEKP